MIYYPGRLILGPAAQRGEGGAVLVGDRWLFDQLLRTQAGHFAATAATGGKHHHQNGVVAQSSEISSGTGG